MKYIALFMVASLTLVGWGGGEESTQVLMRQQSESSPLEMESVQEEQAVGSEPRSNGQVRIVTE